ncbi:hypothetical protein UFOVP1329_41 [uncultured Caudovirales phage]|uniref:Uncharacterized protein n=1 Tax=uncultured Caudovirales phage TaxID=2100421 RepID=A0A6J5RTV0_9CAUD|nr:hypothetical protein UFOVP1150_22 [uncultured Caudovirales phage]CAB4199372.1 hypothetical protein UFOVP1329_41 [uncultured Caudovirales phage]CAB4218800.1 hypothetical protein UFOVP1595_39 [uncultured Caudovirales phage]
MSTLILAGIIGSLIGASITILIVHYSLLPEVQRDYQNDIITKCADVRHVAYRTGYEDGHRAGLKVGSKATTRLIPPTSKEVPQ